MATDAASDGIPLLLILNIFFKRSEYYGAAEPPVRCGESHLSGLTEPPIDSYSA